MEKYQTKIVTFSSQDPIEALKQGQVVAFPTETVYGLGCIYSSYEAFSKLVEVKKRPPDKPFTLMGGNNFNFDDFAYIDEKTRRVIDKFVPGPLTLLLKPKPHLPHHVTLNSKAIGIRVSNSQKLQEFIGKVGQPLLVPSANLSSKPPLISAKEVYEQFNGEIPYIIDDICNNKAPSTIVDFSSEGEIKLIRQGEIKFEDILACYKGE